MAQPSLPRASPRGTGGPSPSSARPWRSPGLGLTFRVLRPPAAGLWAVTSHTGPCHALPPTNTAGPAGQTHTGALSKVPGAESGKLASPEDHRVSSLQAPWVGSSEHPRSPPPQPCPDSARAQPHAAPLPQDPSTAVFSLTREPVPTVHSRSRTGGP